MTVTGKIAGLWVSPGSGKPMATRGEARAVENFGLETCAHGRRGSRQVLLVEAEVLAAKRLKPGQIKENITTEGVALQDLSPGTVLQLGSEVLLEVTRGCQPCRKLEAIRRGLSDDLLGKRGVLARVRAGGILHVGDVIAVLSVPDAAEPAA